jgi:hypothetical protein
MRPNRDSGSEVGVRDDREGLETTGAAIVHNELANEIESFRIFPVNKSLRQNGGPSTSKWDKKEFSQFENG